MRVPDLTWTIVDQCGLALSQMFLDPKREPLLRNQPAARLETMLP